MKIFEYKNKFELECGKFLPEISIAYTTYGNLNKNKSNVIWICHALTANSNVAEWWDGIVGQNNVIDTEKYFIICANIIGSCYGSTGPLSINPQTQQPFYSAFPLITIRDMVKAHNLLRNHLDIQKIHLLIGGSMGGYQALEWSFINSNVIQNLFLLATSASESAWGIATHTAQRLSIEADCTWNTPMDNAGNKGLKAARAIGMLTYRNYSIMVQQQSDTDVNKFDDYKASSYIKYQGEKLANRFNAYSYWLLTKSMDSHNLARNRTSSMAEILQQIKAPTLIIGINSDILCPLIEQQFLATHIPKSTLIQIDSNFGHDGFMVESKKISLHLAQWLNDKKDI